MCRWPSTALFGEGCGVVSAAAAAAAPRQVLPRSSVSTEGNLSPRPTGVRAGGQLPQQLSS